MLKRLFYTPAMFLVYMLTLVPIADAIDVEKLLAALNLDREELVNIRTANEHHAREYRETKEWYDQEAAMFDAALQASKSLYDHYSQELRGAETSRTLAAADIAEATEMLEALSGGSTSDPAIQYWINERDAARRRYNDADSEVFRLKPLVSNARTRYNRDQATMDNLIGWRDYAAEWEALHNEYAAEAQRRIDEIDAEIARIKGENQ